MSPVLSTSVFLLIFCRKRTRKKKKKDQREKTETGTEIRKKTETATERRNANGIVKEKERGNESVKNVNDEKKIGTVTVTNAIETVIVIGIEIGIVTKQERRIEIPIVTERKSVIMMKMKKRTEEGVKGNRERRTQPTKRYAFLLDFRTDNGMLEAC